MDVIQTEEDKPRFRQSNVVIIGPVNVIEQNKLSKVMANHLDYPNGPGNVFFQYSMTPVLLMVNSRAPSGGNPKPDPLGPDSLLKGGFS